MLHKQDLNVDELSVPSNCGDMAGELSSGVERCVARHLQQDVDAHRQEVQRVAQVMHGVDHKRRLHGPVRGHGGREEDWGIWGLGRWILKFAMVTGRGSSCYIAWANLAAR
jgi:hypothetical protein